MSSTPDQFNICIVGLSVANMTVLRQLCRQIIPQQYEIRWVNVADPDLDFLIIDTDFVQARSIQNILSYHPVPVLKIVRYPSVAQNICDDTLYLPVNNIALLSNWIDSHLFDAHHQKKLTVTTSERPVETPQPVQPDLHLFERLHGKTLGLVKLIDAKGILGVADTAQELFWPSPRLSMARPVDHTLGIAHSTNRELQEMSAQSHDLKQWLWDLVWHSPSYTSLLSATDCVQLVGWPQPAADRDRHDVLQLSARLHQQALTAQQLAEQTQIDVSRVQLFTSALVASGLAKTIPSYQNSHPVSKPVASEIAVQDSKKRMGFLSKLRHQFGL